MQQYLKDSARTASVISEIRPDIFEKDINLGCQLVGFMEVGLMADLMKRSIFYNESVEKTQERKETNKSKLDELGKTLLASRELAPEEFKFSPQEIDIIHTCLGLSSEISEILEELLNSKLEKRELNLVNLGEETGDLLWYIALMLRAINTDFETVSTKNINKLKVRFPNNFNGEDALQRDLFEENKVLEA